MGINDTEAPTNAKTKALLEFDEDDITTFVTMQYQYYLMHGKLLTKEIAIKDYSFEADEFDALLQNPSTLTQLAERGVITRGQADVKINGSIAPKLDDDGNSQPVSNKKLEAVAKSGSSWRDGALEPLQLLVANAMLDLVDTRSQKKKLQDMGVSTTKYDTWLRDPIFQAYLKERAENLIGDSSHEAMLALVDKVRMGDMKAIQYYMEFTGRFTPVSATGNQATVGTDQFKNLLTKILDILTDEIDDPQLMARLADRFQTLIGNNNLATQLVEAEIIQPEVAKPNEIPASLQKLMTEQTDV